MKPTSEAAFETVIEAHLLDNGYVSLSGDDFIRERAIFPIAALGFICETQPREWARLEALHGSRTGEQVLIDRFRSGTATRARWTVPPRWGSGLVHYESEKTADDDAWHHATVKLKPLNLDFQPSSSPAPTRTMAK